MIALPDLQGRLSPLSEPNNTCCACKGVGTVYSPGGKCYCDRCGRCARCGGSVTEFQPYQIMHLTINACPCLARADETMEEDIAAGRKKFLAEEHARELEQIMMQYEEEEQIDKRKEKLKLKLSKKYKLSAGEVSLDWQVA